MSNTDLSDGEGKERLRAWPQRPREFFVTSTSVGFWLRAQPPDGGPAGPTLVSPGATLFAAQPDGLWLWFSELDFVDVIAVDVCRKTQNLNDKRSRYMPTTHALLVDCSAAWLTTVISLQGGGQRARWQACGTIAAAPTQDVRLPVRHLRVLYALPNDLYDDWLLSVTPGAHEFFCRHSSLGSHNSEAFREFLSRMNPGAQYYTRPRRP